MRPFTHTISLAEARRRLEAAVRPIERTETVPTADAAGRVAAGDVTSPIAVPPFDRAVMDGYAVVAADTRGASPDRPATLRVVERLHAGSVPTRRVDPGTCAEIATGAPIPEGADAVVMVEQTRLAPDTSAGAEDQNRRVAILAAAEPGQHIGRRGTDLAPGDLVVRRGDVLFPARVGALAAVGHPAALVYAKPRVAVLSTGSEVAEPGQPLGHGRVYDVNRFTLAAIVAAHGGEPDPRRPVPDEVSALLQAFDACAGADLVVFSGGSSVGERDLVVDLVAARGGEMVFHGVAIKPGMPTAFARIGNTPFLGMPGNPTSCLSNAYVLLVPFLRAIARLPPHAARTVSVPLGRRVTSPAGRHQFYTVRVVSGVAVPAFKGSGEITSLSEADGFFEIPPDQTVVEEGVTVEVTLF
jgi:molybdenum cofactor synthesis domain-containing protein